MGGGYTYRLTPKSTPVMKYVYQFISMTSCLSDAHKKRDPPPGMKRPPYPLIPVQWPLPDYDPPPFPFLLGILLPPNRPINPPQTRRARILPSWSVALAQEVAVNSVTGQAAPTEPTIHISPPITMHTPLGRNTANSGARTDLFQYGGRIPRCPLPPTII